MNLSLSDLPAKWRSMHQTWFTVKNCADELEAELAQQAQPEDSRCALCGKTHFILLPADAACAQQAQPQACDPATFHAETHVAAGTQQAQPEVTCELSPLQNPNTDATFLWKSAPQPDTTCAMAYGCVKADGHSEPCGDSHQEPSTCKRCGSIEDTRGGYCFKCTEPEDALAETMERARRAIEQRYDSSAEGMTPKMGGEWMHYTLVYDYVKAADAVIAALRAVSQPDAPGFEAWCKTVGVVLNDSTESKYLSACWDASARRSQPTRERVKETLSPFIAHRGPRMSKLDVATDTVLALYGQEHGIAVEYPSMKVTPAATIMCRCGKLSMEHPRTSDCYQSYST